MKKIYPAVAASLGLVTILLGAFGAHALKEQLDVASMESFETGVRYMMYHVLGIFIINSSSQLSSKSKTIVSQFFLAGILFFSGSIFVISLDFVQAKTIWFITPLGGLFFITGWLIATLSFLKSDKKN